MRLHHRNACEMLGDNLVIDFCQIAAQLNVHAQQSNDMR